MNAQNTNRWKTIFALVGSLSATGTALADDGVPITPELTARWWQWALSIPSSVHPLSQKSTDATGADYCMVGQQGHEWFLGGVFKTVDPSATSKDPTEPKEVVPTEIVRQCRDVPLGKTILLPVLNAECNTAEELALGNDVPKDLLGKTRYLRNCVEGVADAVDKTTVTASFGPKNGPLTPIEVKRVHTILPFSVTYPPENILSRDCPGGFLCNPDPNPSLAQADGYWVHVRPLKPGKYKLQSFGAAPAFDFALRITYTLTVVGPKDQ